jgi:tetratricopeptide (TPR) repeat protein
MTRALAALAVFALTLASAAGAHEEGAKGQLGKVEFANSCSADVQADLASAMAILHSFWFSAGEGAFREVLRKDPECAIATWGIASIMMNNALAGQGASPKGAEIAQAAIEQGRRLGAKTQRERDYLEAVAAYYADFANRSERARQESRAKAYEALAQRYPQDDEAQIFYALYLAATQVQSDQTYAAYRKAAAILEKHFARYPDHPGVAHYLIHSYDAAPIAKQGLTAAKRYAGIAPDAPHALHMPSHIFTRVGAWEESIATNRRSARVAVAGNEADESYHASDYAVYGLLQLARDDEARREIDGAMKVQGISDRFVPYYAIAAMEARYAVERGNWKEASALPVRASKYPFVDAQTVFARAIGAARSGDVAGAQREADALATLHKQLQEAKNNYWATEVEVQRLAAAGWIALAGKNNDDALKFMRAAADLEDRNEKHIVTPGRIVPARELLGDMLMEIGQPAQALKEYEASQEREPNRFRGLYGSAVAAEASGDRAKASAYYARLAEMTRGASSARPEMMKLKASIASR